MPNAKKKTALRQVEPEKLSFIFSRFSSLATDSAFGGVGLNAEPPQITSELGPPMSQRDFLDVQAHACSLTAFSTRWT
jgi:hypothetical protein